MTATAELSDDQLSDLAQACSNLGRWGREDELGTLNLIDDAVRRRAAALVRTGERIPLGRPLPTSGSTVAAHPVVHRMLAAAGDSAVVDSIEITPHDPQITHIDALGHTYLGGRAYNGRHQPEVAVTTGLTSLSVAAMAGGILCRGVLLDVAGARGVDHLEAGDYVEVSDLEAAEQLEGVRVGTGDALVVHVGRAERIASQQLADTPAPRAGLHASVLRWLRERDVAVFLGDCTERLPPTPSVIPLPLHQIGCVAMGLCLIDGALTSRLVAMCRRLRRYEFMFVTTVPELAGATGFPVNPLCVF